MSSTYKSRSRLAVTLRSVASGLLVAGASQAMAASVTLCAEPYTQALPGVPATCKREVTVKLYKLHLYRVGGFFDTHVDTAHADNHIATQILVLPSLHEGGELHVMHDGREIGFESSESVRFPPIANPKSSPLPRS